MHRKDIREIEARNKNRQHEITRGDVEAGNSSRHEIALLAPDGCVALEAGVDTGQFSERLWKTGRFSSLDAVDKWDDHAHSNDQYLAVCQKLMPYQEIRLWRMTAQHFSTMNPTEKYGFIYMDCYAHTGQDSGGVLDALWPLLAEGGIFAGDDYDSKQWPHTFAAANIFAESVGRTVHVFDQHCNDNPRPVYDTYPSWWIRK